MLRRQITNIGKRFASSAYASTQISQFQSPPQNVEKISKLPNGLTVSSLDTNGAVAQLIIAYRAGSRYESHDEKGLTHHLRNMIGIDSANFNGSLMLWHCGSAGAKLVSSLTRDLLFVHMSVIREHASIGLSLLGELSQPAFKPWDVLDRSETISNDLNYSSPEAILMDELHYAAFREGPLGNCLMARESEIGQITFKQLEKYASSRFVSGQAILAGVNVDHEQLLSYASQQLNMNESLGKEGHASRYYGGEIRQNRHMRDVYVAVAGQGASLKDSKALAEQVVFCAAMVQKSAVNYSFKAHGIVSNSVYKASNGYPFKLAAINEIYSDNGLVGIYLECDGDRVGPLIDAAAKAIKNFSVTDADLNRAKATASMNVLSRSEYSSVIIRDRVEQISANGTAISTGEFIKLINSVTSTEVNKRAKQMCSKLTLVSYGNIRHVPYMDEL